jgi:hypothetical protein
MAQSLRACPALVMERDLAVVSFGQGCVRVFDCWQNG